MHSLKKQVLMDSVWKASHQSTVYINTQPLPFEII